MANKRPEAPSRAKGQSRRLEKQHELGGGPAGIFGDEAKRHDLSIRLVMERVANELRRQRPKLMFRHRQQVTKQEINDKLASVDPKLGQVLFVENASIKPDGGIIEVEDKFKNHRVVLVSESKHQGNDVQKIRAGVKQGKNKDKPPTLVLSSPSTDASTCTPRSSCRRASTRARIPFRVHRYRRM